jgi:hypothetical protein
VESAVDARQGVTGHNVRFVLLISSALVIACIAIVYMLVGT